MTRRSSKLTKVFIVSASGHIGWAHSWDVDLACFASEVEAKACQSWCESEITKLISKYEALERWVRERYASADDQTREDRGYLNEWIWWERRKPKWLFGPGSLDKARDTEISVTERSVMSTFEEWRKSPQVR